MAALSEVEAKITTVRAKIDANRPRPLEMPANLPGLYRTHVENLVGTLTKEPVAGRAGDEIRKMIDRLVVRYEPGIGTHTVEIFGNLAAMLAGADSKNAASYDAAARSLKMVAGA